MMPNMYSFVGMHITRQPTTFAFLITPLVIIPNWHLHDISKKCSTCAREGKGQCQTINIGIVCSTDEITRYSHGPGWPSAGTPTQIALLAVVRRTVYKLAATMVKTDNLLNAE